MPQTYGEKENMDENDIMKRLENEDLKTPIHLNELWYSTIEEDVFVDAEPESVNANTFHFDKDSLKCVTLSA